MALSHIDYLMLKQLNIPSTINISLLENELSKLNKTNNAIIKETYLIQHQEVHRICDNIKKPVLMLQNRWLYLNNQIALINSSYPSNIPIEKLIYYEVIPKILWLELLIQEQFQVDKSFMIKLIDCQDFKNLFVSSIQRIFNYTDTYTFAEDIINNLHIRWKKYLERTYLSLLDLYHIFEQL